MTGSFGLGNSPSTTWRSVRQTPQEATRTRTSPEPGIGSGKSVSTRRWPGCLSCIACMKSFDLAHSELYALIRVLTLHISDIENFQDSKTANLRLVMRPIAQARDMNMLSRCIELSRQATDAGENPFACVVCREDEIVAEATTRARRDADVTRHAEIIAIVEAQNKLGTRALSKCTIYSNVEPCAMCSFCIRETGIGRVVYCLPSPIMGGLSKWNILGDLDISNVLPEVFHKPPEIVSGLMEAEAEEVWRAWHPIDWAILRHRQAIGSSVSDQVGRTVLLPQKRGIWHRLLSMMRRPGD